MLAIGTAAGLAGVGIGGHIAPYVLLPSASAPLAVGMAMMFAGAGLRGRWEAWYVEDDKRSQARTARRVGWTLVGVGSALAVGGALALSFWPRESCTPRHGPCRPQAFGGYLATAVGVGLTPPMFAGGGVAATWGESYRTWRNRRVRLYPGGGGFTLRF
jgi:hypothetical protein